MDIMAFNKNLYVEYEWWCAFAYALANDSHWVFLTFYPKKVLLHLDLTYLTSSYNKTRGQKGKQGMRADSIFVIKIN